MGSTNKIGGTNNNYYYYYLPTKFLKILIIIISILFIFCNGDHTNNQIHDSSSIYSTYSSDRMINNNNNRDHHFVDDNDDDDDDDVSFVFSTKSLPMNEDKMPVLSNGHIAFALFTDSIYMNGFYNGEKGLSHRARIPNYSNIELDICTRIKNNERDLNESCNYSLNTKTGIFKIVYKSIEFGYKIEQFIYPHRYHNRAIINQIYVHRGNYKDEIKIKLNQNPGKLTDDIKLSERKTIIIENMFVTQQCGQTIDVEDKIYQKELKNICILWNHVPEQITIKRKCNLTLDDCDDHNNDDDDNDDDYIDYNNIENDNDNVMSFKFVMTLDEHLNFAVQEMSDVLSKSDNLLIKSHEMLWNEFWMDFDIKIDDENRNLGKTIHSSLYYLMSALPSLKTNLNQTEIFNLSPTGGIGGRNLDDYEGHSMWDTEIWMQPSIQLINPKWSEILLHYRFSKIGQAKDFAASTGYKGARFPWESAYTGRDVTQPCCPLVSKNQFHITADISFALRSHLGSTHDLNWFHKEGCTLAIETAKFWESRVEFNNLTGIYEIKNVMGPDEDHPEVSNNVYTNVIVGFALQFGSFASCLCNFSTPTNWTHIAENLQILYDPIKDYHPQFENYQIGEIIKQADTVLLGYPLMYSMNDQTKRNDLLIYSNVTRQTGPAMTWGIFAINYLDLNDQHKAAEYFNKSYKPYIKDPFNVWGEVMSDAQGATNFITGAGGFLQEIIYGYGGIRLHLDHLEIRQSQLPPKTNNFQILGFNYMNARFDLIIDNQSVKLKCRKLNENYELQIQISDSITRLKENFEYNIFNEHVVIRPISSVVYNCMR